MIIFIVIVQFVKTWLIDDTKNRCHCTKVKQWKTPEDY
jgi:hypothetical protein